MLIVTDGAVDVPKDCHVGSPMCARCPERSGWEKHPFTGRARRVLGAAARRGVYPSTSPPTVSALGRGLPASRSSCSPSMCRAV